MTNSSADYKSHKVGYIGPDGGDYTPGKEYQLMIQKLSDGRYAVFKSTSHYNEAPGYKLFNDYESIKQQFNGL